MSINGLTDNVNMLSPTGFRLTIDHTLFANIEYFITSFTIPEIGINEVSIPHRGHTVFHSGEPINFGSLSVRFIIDEDMKNYTEIYDWIYRNHISPGSDFSDMILTVLSSHNNSNKQFQFQNAFPTTLSGAEFNTQATEVEYLQADITFRYDLFKILK